MTDRQVKLLYDHFIKDNQIQIDGMRYVSHWVPENKEIEIWIENVDDVSYSTSVVDEIILNSIKTFSEMVGENADKYLDINYPYMGSGGRHGLYINDEDSKRIYKSAEKIKYIGSDEIELTSSVKVIIEDINLGHNDYFDIYVTIQMTNPKLNGKPINAKELFKYLKKKNYEFFDWYHDNEYDIFNPVLHELMVTVPKNLIDFDWMYVNFMTAIKNQDGEIFFQE